MACLANLTPTHPFLYSMMCLNLTPSGVGQSMKTGILLTPADTLARWHYMQMAAAHGYTACHHHTNA